MSEGKKQDKLPAASRSQRKGGEPLLASGMNRPSWMDPIFRFCLHNKLIVTLLLLIMTIWGLQVVPFDWNLSDLPRDPVPVDAIPDLGENQQIVFTRWPGRSPRDMERQVTYPLTSALMGVSGLKTVRSFSSFGSSTIYLIFRDNIDFYWARSRVLEKLNSLPPDTVPKHVKPLLGPDATALGQIFSYTLEGRDRRGQPTGGWSLPELRKLQDWNVRYILRSAKGVAEVASVGGFVPEYQISIDPDKLRLHGVTLQDLYKAVRLSNREVGARAIEINRVEYVVLVRGYLKAVADIENTVIRVQKGRTLTVKDVATVALGPAPRRGVLDKDGAQVVGGVVVARYGANPLQVIQNVKAKIAELSKTLPRKKLKDGRWSQVTVVPFYDRTKLIKETLHTLEEAIILEVLVTILVVIAMLMHLRSSLLIAGLLPVAVLFCFLAMKLFGVGANIVALSGIAIAIGTMVDMGIVLSENIIQHLDRLEPEEKTIQAVMRATSEVGPAILTAVSTTVIGFLPVFALQAAEGRLFRPLAFTKTFALLAALFVALFVLPPLAHMLFLMRTRGGKKVSIFRDAWLHFSNILLVSGGMWIALFLWWWMGMLILLIPLYRWSLRYLPHLWSKMSWWVQRFGSGIGIAIAGSYLVLRWMPLGHDYSYLSNFIFVALLVGGVLFSFEFFRRIYVPLLRWFLVHKKTFLLLPFLFVLLGATIWLGFDTVFGWAPRAMISWSQPPPSSKKVTKGKRERVRSSSTSAWLLRSSLWKGMSGIFPGLRKEFMPELDEGSFLLMPTTMPHASMGQAIDTLQKLDRAIRSIPEISVVVGKIGRMNSALDSTPISMVETVIHYKSKFRVTAEGRRIRQWRKHIRSPKDIWREIVHSTRLLGTTKAPHLQPIGARLVMLQSGMRSSMGVKVKGPDLKAMEKFSIALERVLKQVPQIERATVVADRVNGKPYLEFSIHRKVMTRYGLKLSQVQDVIQAAIGGRKVTTTFVGDERYGVVVRYQRELHHDLQDLQKIMISTPQGVRLPIMQIASLRYVRGPQVIKTEDLSLVAHVIFDRKKQFSQVETVEAAKRLLHAKIKSGELRVPAGMSFYFAGAYESQVRSEKRLLLVLPLALFLIFLILYLQFRSVAITGFIFSGILVAWAGGFLLIWLYQTSWFLNFSVFGIHMREIFSIHGFHMSVAVWVGFVALFGIATDDGVVMATFLKQSFAQAELEDIRAVREATIAAGERRILPCLMTTATTLLALLPVLTSTGRGSGIMIPMAIPSFGGMLVELLTLFVVPVLYCWREEFVLRRRIKEQAKRKRWWQFWKRVIKSKSS